jgi:phage/plasmid primase-like uncharacterized protein
VRQTQFWTPIAGQFWGPIDTDQAEAVCRYYLPAGRREGGYWRIGDLRNAPGRSLYERLTNAGAGAAGKWADAATGEHGDLLDLIRETRRLATFAEAIEEARAFLRLSRRETETRRDRARHQPFDRRAAARRIIAASLPIAGTIAETYLRHRGICDLPQCATLRFHPRCFYRDGETDRCERWPALLAVVSDLASATTGVHRTYLARDGCAKAPIATPRRSLGAILGHGLRFDRALDVMAAGEGVETVLSLECAMPTMPMVAALSASNLAAILLPRSLRRLYVARDADHAAARATSALCQRATQQGVEAIALTPRLGDFNDDLRALGVGALRAWQPAPHSRFEERPLTPLFELAISFARE